MSNKLIDKLNQGPVICAEGFLFEIERRGYLSAGEFVPTVALDRPDVLEALHRDFQHAGSDIVQAFTYNVHREKVRVAGKEHLLEKLNRAALQIARKVTNISLDQPKPNLMAGNISNSNIWNENDKKVQLEVEKMFSEMAQWAVDEKADIMIGETFYYAEEAFKALEIIKKTNLPAVITIAPMGENKMRDNWSIVDTCKELEQRGADVVGMNCFRGPNTMKQFVLEIRKAVKCHVAALPVPYRTNTKHQTFFNLPDRSNECGCESPHGRTFPTALDPLYCNRYEIAKFSKEVYDKGINYLGVCCGASPALIREVAHAVGLRVSGSKYKENMKNHFMYGDNQRIPKHIKEYGDLA